MEVALEDVLKGSSNIIDIRDSFSFDSGHIEGAININYNDLINNPNKYLSKNVIYYIYCQKGVKSLECCYLLRSLGYNVYSIVNGYDAYNLR